MATLFITFFVFLLIVAGMAVGVLMGRKPISGSCGGMSALGVLGDCEICGGNPSKCDSEVQAGQKNTASFYNAAD